MTEKKTDKTPKLIFEALPPRTRKGGASKYVPNVQEFLASDAPSARVVVEGAAPTAIAAGLKTAIRNLDADAVVGVTNRASAGVYLVRK